MTMLLAKLHDIGVFLSKLGQIRTFEDEGNVQEIRKLNNYYIE